MNRNRLDRAVVHLAQAELGACCTRSIAVVLDALEQYRATVTTGGPTRDPDLNWAPGTLPPPPSATDPNAPAHRRGPNRTDHVPR